MATDCLNLFLQELSSHHPDHHIILVMDGAPSHCGKERVIPDNMSIIPLPPYSPELNPVENFWKELKKKGFYNRIFTTLMEVEDQMEAMLKYFYDHPQLVQSIVGYSWILNALN